MKRLIFISAFLGLIFISFFSHAQLIQDEEIVSLDSVILEKEISGGIIIHTQGLGGELRISKNKTASKKQSFEFELLSMKSPKQYKTINPYFANSKSFIFGKLNHVYFLRVGYAEHKLISRKPYWGGIELRYFYTGGVSLGIAKPIYLYILKMVDQQIYEYTSERYDPDEHSIEDIYGRAPFIKGLNEVKFYPGAYAKAGFSFELGVYKSKTNYVEVGAVIDALPFGIPMMAFNNKKNIFLTFFLSYQIGSRYNP